MLKVGIIGSENSHSLHFAKLMNVEKKMGGARCVAIWGETPELSQNVAGQAQIPEIVGKPEDLIGKVDAAIIDHRHARYHVPAATPLVKAGIPVLIDKPYSWTVDEGRRLLALAEKKNVMVTSYSCVRFCDGFVQDRKKMAKLGELSAVDYYGPCDIHSEYGGVFFYGIHQVEMMASHLGVDIDSVQFNKGRAGHHTATVFYKSGIPIVTLHFINGYRGGFRYTLCGCEGTEHLALNMAGLYERGLKAFFRMVKSGHSDFSKRELLGPVAVLEAIARSIKSGKREKLSKF